MNPNQTGPLTRTCDVTGAETTGKLYILRTTDGPEELVSGRALFEAALDGELLQVLEGMQAHIDRLEERLEDVEQHDVDQEAGDPDAAVEEKTPEDRVQEAAKEAAAPVKKTRAPKQRGASD